MAREAIMSDGLIRETQVKHSRKLCHRCYRRINGPCRVQYWADSGGIFTLRECPQCATMMDSYWLGESCEMEGWEGTDDAIWYWLNDEATGRLDGALGCARGMLGDAFHHQWDAFQSAPDPHPTGITLGEEDVSAAVEWFREVGPVSKAPRWIVERLCWTHGPDQPPCEECCFRYNPTVDLGSWLNQQGGHALGSV
jgi:hypothetical protein